MHKTLEVRELPIWKDLEAKHIPTSCELEVTARCNNKCRHCYINLPADDTKAQTRELTVAQIDAIAGQAVELGVLWCLVTGGEPLLRPDFKELYLALKRRGLLVSVFTNATLVNEHHIALFKEYPPHDMEITVYGATRNTYERVTKVPGSFDKFMRGLTLLMENNLEVRLKTVAIQSNLEEQAAIAEFCQSRTKDYFRFDPKIHLRYDRDMRRNKDICSERLTPEQVIKLENTNKELIKAQRKRTPLCNDKTDSESNHIFNCGAGKNSFSISYDGIFRLCPSLWAEGMTYDLRSGTLADAWHNFVPYVRNMRIQGDKYQKSCQKCILKYLCSWCPANAHLETGTLDEPIPFFCEVAQARKENLDNGAGLEAQGCR